MFVPPPLPGVYLLPAIPQPPPFFPSPPKGPKKESEKLNNIKSNFSDLKRITGILSNDIIKNIKNLLSDEVIYYSGHIDKINKDGKKQSRIIVLTQKSLYNIKINFFGKISIQRKFLYKDMIGISLSNTSF